MASLTTSTEIGDFIALSTTPTGSTGGEIWEWWAGILVLIMHMGFAFLEAGSVQKKNALNVMFKNIITITLGGVCYYILGYAIFSAGEPGNTFAGGDNWFLTNELGIESDASATIPDFGSQFFFQFAFAATAATIVSGAVAGRITLPAYTCVVILLTSFTYPCVTHWVWASTGWLTNFYSSCFDSFGEDACGNAPIVGDGLRDFAGSGVVHMSGAFSALAGIIVLGPREDSIKDGSFDPPAPCSHTLMAIGVFILWIGWYGFNCGSTLTFEGYASGMGHAAICTTLAPASAIVVAMFYSKLRLGYYDLPIMLNSCLSGLVAITASANIMDFGWTVFIGAVATPIYVASSALLKKLSLDDPVGAIPVHGFCGIWGVLAVPISTSIAEADKGGQWGAQILGVVVIIAWNFAMTFLLFFAMAGFTLKDNDKKEKFLRASKEMQEKGLDESEHAGEIYSSF